MPSAVQKQLDQIKAQKQIQQIQVARARKDLGYFIDQCEFINRDDGTVFRTHITDPATTVPCEAAAARLDAGEITHDEYLRLIYKVLWGFQWDYVYRELMVYRRVITYKARQLGITWINCAFDLWIILYHSGTGTSIYRQKEESAAENIQRMWIAYKSLRDKHPHLVSHVEVLKPSPGHEPTTEIVFRHKENGQTSESKARASTDTEGHGAQVARVTFDEWARITRAAQLYRGNIPTMSREGRFGGISTAFGVSNPETGEGNHFHYAWMNAEILGLRRIFYPWFAHPDRNINGEPNQEWYDNCGLIGFDRQEQYPATPEEGFAASGDPWFDRDAIEWYRENAIKEPLYRMLWEETGYGEARQAKIHDLPINGYSIHIFTEPVQNHDYCIYADVSKGTASDYSVFYVADLATGQICAQFRGKVDFDVLAQQIHYTSHWYGATTEDKESLVAIERNSSGEAVIIQLSTGKDGVRPPIRRIYRHDDHDLAVKSRTAKTYGFPVNKHTRTAILAGLQADIRDHVLAFVTHEIQLEMQTFSKKMPPATSPAADSGCNDDCVMALAGMREMIRRYGYTGSAERNAQAQLTNFRPPAVGTAMIDRR